MRLLLVLLLLPFVALAHDVEKGDIHIADPWIQAPVGLGKAAAGYLEIIDMGGEGDRLISASSDSAARVDLHTHIDDGGILRMRPLEGVAINPMGGVDFQPGGQHLMLMGLTRKIEPGEKIIITLVFEGVGAVDVPFKVRGR